jgi:methanogenic corrinoid protein MtbC1
MDEQRLKFIAQVADLKELEVLAQVQERLAKGGDPLAIIEDCQEGLRQVGRTAAGWRAV